MMSSELAFGVPDLTEPLAVVPIVVNAGAALFPAILAAITTCVALLFRPREWVRVCREKPWVPIAVIGSLSAVAAALIWWPAPTDSAATRHADRARAKDGARSRGGDETVFVDWTRVALARIEARRRAIPSGTGLIEPGHVFPEKVELQSDIKSTEPFIFRAGPQRLGALGQAPTAGLQQVWQRYPVWVDDGGVESDDTEAMILSSPAVHGQRIFGASCLLDPPDTFGTVFCVDATSGRMIWSTDKMGDVEFKGFFSSPAVSADGRSLVIGQGLHPDTNCELICLDTESGQVRWTLPTPLHLESSPVIAGNEVYIGAGAIEDPTTHRALSHPGYVLAASLTDGRELWRHDIADPESSPVVGDGLLFIGSGFNGKAIVALRTDPEIVASERELWRTETPYPITGAITLAGDRVIAGGGNGDFVYRDPNPAGVVLALDAATGAIVWQSPMPDAVLGAVAAGERLVCGVANGEVRAIDPKDGSLMWATRVSGIAPVLAAPAVTSDEVFAVSQDGYLARLKLESGEVLEKVYLNSETKPGAQGLSISSPLVVDQLLLVGSETGGLRAYTGTPTP